eukprot:m.216734 g.216734  ORF g.216734 m.216734 type:complete len:157 (+) comp26233_c1_seq2:72-542(+)
MFIEGEYIFVHFSLGIFSAPTVGSEPGEETKKGGIKTKALREVLKITQQVLKIIKTHCNDDDISKNLGAVVAALYQSQCAIIAPPVSGLCTQILKLLSLPVPTREAAIKRKRIGGQGQPQKKAKKSGKLDGKDQGKSNPKSKRGARGQKGKKKKTT